MRNDISAVRSVCSGSAAQARHQGSAELHTTQPSISKHVKSLEDEYKTRLFRRNGKGIEITREGAELFTYVEPILAQVKLIEQRFVKNPTTIKPTPLKVGGTSVLSATIIPVLLKKFHDRYSTVPVILRTNPTRMLTNMVIKGTLELALISAPAETSELVAEQCIPLKLVAFARKGYQLPFERDLNFGAGSELPLIIRGGRTQNGITEVLLKDLRKRGYKPKIVLECESPEALKMAVKQRLGVGFSTRRR